MQIHPLNCKYLLMFNHNKKSSLFRLEFFVRIDSIDLFLNSNNFTSPLDSSVCRERKDLPSCYHSSFINQLLNGCPSDGELSPHL